MRYLTMSVAAAFVVASCASGGSNGPDGTDSGGDTDGGDTANQLVWEDDTSGVTLQWQNVATTRVYTFDEAVTYCDGLDWAGHSDWHLPTISELRSLVRGCADGETGGDCGLTDSCASDACRTLQCNGACNTLAGPGVGGCYWDPALLASCRWEGNNAWHWSSTVNTDDTRYVWIIDFSGAYFDEMFKNFVQTLLVYCVR